METEAERNRGNDGVKTASAGTIGPSNHAAPSERPGTRATIGPKVLLSFVSVIFYKHSAVLQRTAHYKEPRITENARAHYRGHAGDSRRPHLDCLETFLFFIFPSFDPLVSLFSLSFLISFFSTSLFYLSFRSLFFSPSFLSFFSCSLFFPFFSFSSLTLSLLMTSFILFLFLIHFSLCVLSFSSLFLLSHSYPTIYFISLFLFFSSDSHSLFTSFSF